MFNRPRITCLFSLFVLLFAPYAFCAEKPYDESIDPARPPAIETANVPTVPADLMNRLRQYQNVRSASFAGWSPGGKGILVRTRFGNTSQLHRVFRPGGSREQVTFYEEPASGRFIPKTKNSSLLISMSAGGNENYQVYRLDGGSGKTIRLSDGKSRNLLGPVSHDGGRMIISNNSRNGRDTDLYVADTRIPGFIKRVLQTNGEYWSPRDWSRDGSTLLINHYVSINESYPALLDVASGKVTRIPIPAKGKVSFGDMKFSPDGKSIYVACDAAGDTGSEFRRLARIDLRTFEYTWLSEDADWGVNGIEVDPNSGRVAFTLNVDASSQLGLLEGDEFFVFTLPVGIISSLEFSPDGKEIGFTFSRPNAPSDAFSIRISDHRLTRWTTSEVGGLNPDTFIAPQQIQFPTFDERTIPAYYFKPRGASKEKPVPVILNIHGGPESQYRPYFYGSDQFYLNEMGFAVIRPNVRGSAGYGKSYLLLDNGEKREDSVRDIGALLDWVAEQPELDTSRVAVMGGSYGGYMVLGSLTNFPGRIKAGVDIVGIASFTTFLQNTSAYRRDLRRAEYGDERDPKMQAVFDRINPTANADKIRAALLVAHGKNDPRVPFSEAVQIAEKVAANGQKVWTLYAENEGHGFGKKVNRDYLSGVIALFLQQKLK